MAAKLDLIALKFQSKAILDQRAALRKFISEGSSATALMLFALNALERATGGIGMPETFSREFLFFEETKHQRSVPFDSGNATFGFRRTDGKWGLETVSAVVKEPFDRVSVGRVLSDVLGIEPGIGMQEILRVLRGTMDDNCEEMLTIFDLMPVNSVAALVHPKTGFSQLVGISNLDAYARATIEWLVKLGFPSAEFPVGVDYLHDWMGDIGFSEKSHEDLQAFTVFCRRNMFVDLTRGLLLEGNEHFIRHAFDFGFITLDELQHKTRGYLTHRSPQFIKTLLDIGVQVSASDLENVLLHACFGTSKAEEMGEVLQHLFDAGVSFLGRSEYLKPGREYSVPSEIRTLVTRFRKEQREKLDTAA
jgi:hypothetical protein